MTKIKIKSTVIAWTTLPLGLKKWLCIMKIYAVKGQNCQNEQFNFPWTTLVLKDQNYSTGSPNFVVFHFVGICIFSEKKEKTQIFLLLNEIYLDSR